MWWLALSLAKHHNPVLAVLANILAAWRYQLDFRGNPALVWLRRGWIVVRMIARGEVGSLLTKVKSRLRLGTA